MASQDDIGIGDFVLLDEITVDRVVENLKTRWVRASPRTPARIADTMTDERLRGASCARARADAPRVPFAVGDGGPRTLFGSSRRPREGVACVSAGVGDGFHL